MSEPSKRPLLPRSTASRRTALATAEAHLQAHDGALPVATLSRLVGLSERAFRNAVLGVHGVTPARWMRMRRLYAVRSALLEVMGTTPTVTAVATDFNFYQLGRFAGLYKDAFGEHPSETLRRRAASQSARSRA